jgi:2-keto-4-pentenoate hydratase
MPVIEQAAQALWHAQETATPCPPIRGILGEDASLDDAYAVQQLNISRALQAGQRLTGCKIGLTSVSVQKQLGVNQPDFGRLFASMAVDCVASFVAT